MGIRKERGHGLCGLVLMTAIFCLWSGSMQVYARKDSENEIIIRYSSSYKAEDEIPDAEEEYNEGEISYHLIETSIETVPVNGRTKEVSGEIVYDSVTKNQEIPEKAPMEVKDKESGKTVNVVLPLQNVSYQNEHWQDGFEISVVFHEYGADAYRFEEVVIAHDDEKPPLNECRKQLIDNVGLSEDEVQIESATWAGDAYQDEDGIWCRNAVVSVKRRVWDCVAVYAGVAELPGYNRFRMRMEYEQVKDDNIEETDMRETEIKIAEETESHLVEKESVPFWKQWITYGLTVSLSLILIILAILGFRLLKKMAKIEEK